MDNAIGGFILTLALVVMATLAVLFATSTGILYHQEEDRDLHYTCYYVTATGTFSISVVSSRGCMLLATVEE